MEKVFIKTLALENFRNHERIKINTKIDDRIIAIVDSNGSGKTNLLEAISILSPGSGIRGSNFADMIMSGTQSFRSFYEICSNSENIDTIMMEFDGVKRSIKINNKTSKNSIDLKSICDIIWMTPEIQHDISTSSSNRRNFFDRAMFGFFGDHAILSIDYAKLLKERLKILKQSVSHPVLKTIERQIAEIMYKISYNRNKGIEMISKTMIDDVVSISISCNVDSMMYKNNAIELIQEKMQLNRSSDAHSGRTEFGTHRSDFHIKYNKKNSILSKSSSGEKKNMMLSIFFSIVNAIIDFHKRKPILLLDEMPSFIDAQTRNSIIQKIIDLDIQTWITCTDESDIKHQNMDYIKIININNNV
jgi:DNA replication and repair protein RecF